MNRELRKVLELDESDSDSDNEDSPERPRIPPTPTPGSAPKPHPASLGMNGHDNPLLASLSKPQPKEPRARPSFSANTARSSLGRSGGAERPLLSLSPLSRSSLPPSSLPPPSVPPSSAPPPHPSSLTKPPIAAQQPSLTQNGNTATDSRLVTRYKHPASLPGHTPAGHTPAGQTPAAHTPAAHNKHTYLLIWQFHDRIAILFSPRQERQKLQLPPLKLNTIPFLHN